MTIDNLFGPESKKPRILRLKVIKPIYEILKITEAAAQYLNQKTPLSSSVLVDDMFGFLRRKTDLPSRLWTVRKAAKTASGGLSWFRRENVIPESLRSRRYIC